MKTVLLKFNAFVCSDYLSPPESEEERRILDSFIGHDYYY